MELLDPATPVDKVQLYRAEVLERAGYESLHAFLVAARRDIDLHAAADLVANGCPSVLAVRILL